MIRRICAHDVIAATADVVGVRRESIWEGSRDRMVAFARHVTVWLLIDIGYTRAFAADVVGLRENSAGHSVRLIDAWLTNGSKQSRELRAHIARIRALAAMPEPERKMEAA